MAGDGEKMVEWHERLTICPTVSTARVLYRVGDSRKDYVYAPDFNVKPLFQKEQGKKKITTKTFVNTTQVFVFFGGEGYSRDKKTNK